MKSNADLIADLKALGLKKRAPAKAADAREYLVWGRELYLELLDSRMLKKRLPKKDGELHSFYTVRYDIAMNIAAELGFGDHPSVRNPWNIIVNGAYTT